MKVLAATRKGLFTIEPLSGSGWSISRVDFLGDHVPMAMHDPRDGSLYAALEHGHFGTKLHRSDDGGMSWTEVGVPQYPAQVAGEENKDHHGRPIPWRLEKIWALQAGNPDQPGCVWCGTLPGGLFRSGDRGASWRLVEGLWNHPLRKEWMGGGAEVPGIHSICVHPADGGIVKVGVSCGGVWGTVDGGQTWAACAQGMRAEYMPPELQYEPNAQDPHLVVQCRESPEHFWSQHHNGIFRSTDGAKTWQELADVPVSHFGFTVAVHPRHPETAWFVPAIKDERRIPVEGRVVVTRTRDGGKSFDVLRNGLPQSHAYDLVYRHALDIDPSGDLLAIGSTTGSLWISEDQGDSWQTVSTHLPPIDCVRFVAA
jgi:photosystem II stability/assembly factor-like uncharacterized protein